ncbi:hypothetical protein ACFOWZ_04125 [Lentzea rhizosphaerae]|uniref:Uncharacterized protein n=1 Tax=Lentzea rhizosphaerae TaxID=2041025 RepID=A0ABV8BKC4_9PSEU|nr:hypothetical protein [Lentzea rhizosphaerae]
MRSTSACTAAAPARSVGLSGAPGNSLTCERLPRGHDVTLPRKVDEAIKPGGAVVICEQFVPDDRDGPLEAALPSLDMPARKPH